MSFLIRYISCIFVISCDFLNIIFSLSYTFIFFKKYNIVHPGFILFRWAAEVSPPGKCFVTSVQVVQAFTYSRAFWAKDGHQKELSRKETVRWMKILLCLVGAPGLVLTNGCRAALGGPVPGPGSVRWACHTIDSISQGRPPMTQPGGKMRC